ncbi:MAG: U32 family peptidase [Clostridiales bacterium]|nr:U32 family peptidase [Clostridiales bacterium]
MSKKVHSSIKKPELLSPAGSLESLDFAIRYGADAVYLGTNEYSMRSVSKGFTSENLSEGVRKAHDAGLCVYLACNIIAHNFDLLGLDNFLLSAAAAGVDALIVSDLGLMSRAKKLLPQMEIHISTQLGVTNYETARVLYEMGAKRVVLARELGLEEIAEIRDKTPTDLEIECFVHGAMCVSFSGRCLLSNLLTGRDANRGNCAQPCRWNYALMEEKRPGEFIPVFQDEKGTFVLNSKDLNLLEHLDLLAAAGISSFKIEGRAKNAYYTGVVTNAYRIATDLLTSSAEDKTRLQPWVIEELEKISHRPYSTGFYFDKPKENAQVSFKGGYIRQWAWVATVSGHSNGFLHLVQRNRFFNGDCLEILEPGKKPYTVLAYGLTDDEGTPIESARHPLMKVKFPCEKKPQIGSIVRLKRSDRFDKATNQ